jgi:hypothetical protein
MEHLVLAYPMFAMFMLSNVVLLCNVVIRVRAVRNKQVRAKYFKTFDPSLGTPPEWLVQGKNHIDNIFQVPVLFYAGCLLGICLSVLTPLTIGLAWGYVALRMCHSYIHMTYNHVLHRMLIFVVSNIVLTVLWVDVVFLQL